MSMNKYTERVLWWLRNDEGAYRDVQFFLDDYAGSELALAIESYATVLYSIGYAPEWRRLDKVEWDTIALTLSDERR